MTFNDLAGHQTGWRRGQLSRAPSQLFPTNFDLGQATIGHCTLRKSRGNLEFRGHL